MGILLMSLGVILIYLGTGSGAVWMMGVGFFIITAGSFLFFRGRS